MTIHRVYYTETEHGYFDCETKEEADEAIRLVTEAGWSLDEAASDIRTTSHDCDFTYGALD